MDAPLRIIILSPLEAHGTRIAQELRRAGYAVDSERVDDGLALRAALKRAPWDMIVSEWSLRHFSAPAAIEMVNALGLDIPVVIVSGSFGEEIALAAFRAGARDFLVHDQIHRLPAVVDREIAERRVRIVARGRAGTRAVVAAAPDGILEMDRTGAIFELNPAVEKLLLFSREELLGRSIGDLLPAPALWDAYRRDLERSPSRDDSFPAKRIEAVAVRKDGTQVPVELTLVRLDSTVPVFVAYLRDLSDRMTERRKAEERLHLIEDYLRQAQKLEAIGHLAAGMAHEFNNVLAAILSSSSMLLDEMPASDPRREEAVEISVVAERAASLTRQLLAFLRRQALEPQLIDLNGLVLGVERMLRRLIGPKIELSTALAGGVALVEAPPGQLEQVLVNLVINARDAMPSGGKLHIEIAEVEGSVRLAEGDPERWVMLSISDTGVGMSAETRQQLFQPFFTTKPPGKGTGLGLFTSHTIVTRMGGSITVHSEPSAGSVLKVYLRRATRVAEWSSADQDVPRQISRGTETILLVEGDDQVGSVVQRVLEHHGYSVILARSAAEAVELSGAFPGRIDLVLTDVVTPDASGLELVERVRARRVAVRAVYMTGYLDPTEPQAGLYPTVNLLEKPFTQADILRKVRDTLDAP
jgi:two-component system cell cycle sensor histidine kinase/response regulator CckA